MDQTQSHSHCDCQSARRRFLQLSLALGALALAPGALAADSIRSLRGKVMVDGKLANEQTDIDSGSLLETGADGHLVFTFGQDAFLLRANSSLQLEPDGAAIGVLRLSTGAMLAVFGKGNKQVATATATIGIRGTGIYLEATPEETYFCLCYGEVELQRPTSGPEQETQAFAATRHSAIRIPPQPASISATPQRNHTDAELEMLESLVGRPPHLYAKS